MYVYVLYKIISSTYYQFVLEIRFDHYIFIYMIRWCHTYKEKQEGDKPCIIVNGIQGITWTVTTYRTCTRLSVSDEMKRSRQHVPFGQPYVSWWLYNVWWRCLHVCIYIYSMNVCVRVCGTYAWMTNYIDLPTFFYFM